MNSGLHGLMAEFGSADALRQALLAARAAGYRHLDAYAPFAVEGLDLPAGSEERLGAVSLLFALLGSGGALLLQQRLAAVAYPLDVGGRPLASWPAFAPIAFEFAVLGAAVAAFAGMLAWNRLPQPYHPVFHVPAFERATQDRFFLCVEASDPMFDEQAVRDFLRSLAPVEVSEVPL